MFPVRGERHQGVPCAGRGDGDGDGRGSRCRGRGRRAAGAEVVAAEEEAAAPEGDITETVSETELVT